MQLDTILDYTYDVNYSVQKGECLKLDMNKSLSYCMEYEDHISASNTIPFEMESVDIDGEGRIYHTSTSGFKYDCYLKDHLGSTRMVVNDEDVVTEAFAYQPYGTIIPLEDIAATPQTPTRQQFTGKEFDREGEDSENGVSGIQAYYFGARYYDPEIGYWISPDKLEQFFSHYAYAGNGANPVVMVDKDGNAIFTGLTLAIIGVSAAISGTMTAVKVSQAGGSAGQVFGAFAFGAVAGAAGGALGVVTGGAATAGINAALGAFASTTMGGLVSATAAGAVGGIAGGAASGLIGGASTAMIMGGDLSDAFRAGALGMVNGMITGAITGAVGGAAGYGVSKGVSALRGARNAGQSTSLAKSAQKTDLNFVDKVSSSGTDKILDIQAKPLIPSETNAPSLDLTKYFTVKNPTLDVQPPIFELPITPTQIPTTPVQMSPTIINPLPSGVTPAGGGNYYMISPHADFYFGF